MLLNAPQVFFSGNPLDRADQMRPDPEIFGDLMLESSARVMALASGAVLSDMIGGIYWLKARQCRFLPVEETIFLGLENGEARYAVSLSGDPEDFDTLFPDAKFRDARALAMKVGAPAPHLGIVAQAKSMLAWHETHRFCAKCGEQSRLTKAGYERKCDGCGASHFPRTDPVVIMLACHEDQALVGRGPQLPPGFYSALAGFMEPGETIEEAVARELMEEAGVTATEVRIVANQPWPWPSSLMLGCMAEVTDTKLTLDDNEIDDARWITRQEATAALQGETGPDFMLPPPLAIAHTLIQHWLRSGSA